MVPWPTKPAAFDALAHRLITIVPKRLLPLPSSIRFCIRIDGPRRGLRQGELGLLGARVDRRRWDNYPTQGVLKYFPHRHPLRPVTAEIVPGCRFIITAVVSQQVPECLAEPAL